MHQFSIAWPEKQLFLISRHFLAYEAPWCLSLLLESWPCTSAFFHKQLLSLAAHQIPYDQRQVGECPLVLHRYWSRQRTCRRENQWQSEGLHPLTRHGKRDKCERLTQNCSSKNVTKLFFKVCLSLFFIRPPGLLFLEGQMEFARKCQVLLIFSQQLFCFVLFFSQKRLGFQWKLKTQSSSGENQDIFFLEYHFSDLWELSCRWIILLFTILSWQVTSPPARKNLSSNQGLCMGAPCTEASWPSLSDWSSQQQILNNPTILIFQQSLTYHQLPDRCH